jgi:hypothetical protein
VPDYPRPNVAEPADGEGAPALGVSAFMDAELARFQAPATGALAAKIVRGILQRKNGENRQYGKYVYAVVVTVQPVGSNFGVG